MILEIEDLSEKLNSDDSNLRQEACYLLAKVESKEAADCLARALADPDPRVRMLARKSLDRLALVGIRPDPALLAKTPQFILTRTPGPGNRPAPDAQARPSPVPSGPTPAGSLPPAAPAAPSQPATPPQREPPAGSAGNRPTTPSPAVAPGTRASAPPAAQTPGRAPGLPVSLIPRSGVPRAPDPGAAPPPAPAATGGSATRVARANPAQTPSPVTPPPTPATPAVAKAASPKAPTPAAPAPTATAAPVTPTPEPPPMREPEPPPEPAEPLPPWQLALDKDQPEPFETWFAPKAPKDRIDILAEIEAKPRRKPWALKLKVFLATETDVFVLSKIIKVLGHHHGPGVLSLVEPFLEHEDARVIANTLECLSLAGGRSDLERVTHFLDHPDSRIKSTAANCLWTTHPQTVLDVVKQMAVSSMVWERDAARFALQACPLPEAKELLAKLDQTIPQVRKPAQTQDPKPPPEKEGETPLPDWARKLGPLGRVLNFPVEVGLDQPIPLWLFVCIVLGALVFFFYVALPIVDYIIPPPADL